MFNRECKGVLFYVGLANINFIFISVVIYSMWNYCRVLFSGRGYSNPYPFTRVHGQYKFPLIVVIINTLFYSRD